MKEGREGGGVLIPPGKVTNRAMETDAWFQVEAVELVRMDCSEDAGEACSAPVGGAATGFHPAVVIVLICKRLFVPTAGMKRASLLGSNFTIT